MYWIAHRGNIYGKNIELENRPEYIEDTVKSGYDVEIDVRFIGNKFYLGHDEPQYEVDLDFLKNPKLWCHAKTLETATEFQKHPEIHYFLHDRDDVVLTSRGVLWVHPGKPYNERCIYVMPEMAHHTFIPVGVLGICSDRVGLYKMMV